MMTLLWIYLGGVIGVLFVLGADRIATRHRRNESIFAPAIIWPLAIVVVFIDFVES